MAELLKEEYMKLAINTYNSGLFMLKTAAAKAFNILVRMTERRQPIDLLCRSWRVTKHGRKISRAGHSPDSDAKRYGHSHPSLRL
jgi:hypothetical protein